MVLYTEPSVHAIMLHCFVYYFYVAMSVEATYLSILIIKTYESMIGARKL